MRTPHREQLEAILEQVRTSLGAKNIAVETVLRSGHPAEVLVETARTDDHDLIVIGARGLHFARDILLGGIAQQILEYATAPVLIVRLPYRGLRRILLAIDGSDYSQYALEYLAHFALPTNIDLRVIHVLPAMIKLISTPAPLYPLIGPVLPENEVKAIEAFYTQEESSGHKLLDRTVSYLETRGLRAAKIFQRGDAAIKIIRYAKDNHIDLVIAGSLGLSRVKEWLLGSVSRKLVYHAGCSVLVVKAPSNLV
jgi:nucleotide-binding universal stress UspA family protein